MHLNDMSDPAFKKVDVPFKNDAYVLYDVHITNDPAFKTIDSLYVISMYNSTRRPALITQLKNAGLTKTARILINYGYKQGQKEGIENTTADLLHANKMICMLEQENDNPVVILEDDCEFCASKQELAYAEVLAISGHADGVSLGALMHLSFPGPLGTLRVVSGGLTHAMIYSKKTRAALTMMSYSVGAHDTVVYTQTSMIAPRRPMAVQRHYRTENSLTYDPYGIASAILWILGADQHPVRTYMFFHLIGLFGGIVPIVFFALSLVVTMCFIY